MEPLSEAEALERRRDIGVMAACALWQVLVFQAVFAGKSLWMDEAFSVYAASGSFADLIAVLKSDLHPPGFFALLWLWQLVSPYTERALRLLPLAFALGTIPVLFAAARRIGGREFARWSAAAYAALAFTAHFAAELRAYSMLAFFAALTLLLMLRAEEADDEQWRSRAAAWSVAGAAMLYAHYYGAFVLAAQGAWALAGPKRWRWIGPFAMLAALFAPWLPVVLAQAKSGAAGWIEELQGGRAPLLSPLHTASHFVFGENSSMGDPAQLIATLALVLPAAAFGTAAAIRRGRMDVLAAAAALGPMLIALAISQWRNVYMSRYLTSALPGFALLLAAAVMAIPRPRTRLAAGALMVAALAGAQVHSQRLKPLEDWRGAMDYVAERAGKLGATRVAILTNGTDHVPPISYYLYRLGMEDEEIPVRLAIEPAGEKLVRGDLPVYFVYRSWDHWSARERWRKLFGDRLPGGHETFRGAINVAEFVKARTDAKELHLQ